MTEDEVGKVRAQAREFPETIVILAKVREAMVTRLFKTTQDASLERERLYQAVQILDAMTGQMETVLSSNASSDAIASYIESINTPATTEK